MNKAQQQKELILKHNTTIVRITELEAQQADNTPAIPHFLTDKDVQTLNATG